MAKIVKVTASPLEADLFSTSISTVTLEMTGQEVLTLVSLLRNVAGNTDKTCRRYSRSIQDALYEVEDIQREYERLKSQENEPFAVECGQNPYSRTQIRFKQIGH